MLTANTNRRLTTISQAQNRTKTLLCVLFVLGLGAFLSLRFSLSLKGSDFPDFYCAGRMLADGHGHQLYVADLQRQYQARYTGRVGTLYIHLPVEAALYLAVAWLPLKQAYLLWFWLNIVGLAIAARCMAKNALLPWWWAPLVSASLTFVPVLLCLQQCQDSILLLLLVILAFSALRREQGFAAGFWLGLALFKFQLVVPLTFVLVLACKGKIRSGLARGFSLAAIACAALSAAISGWQVFLNYPKFLMHLPEQPFAGIIPQAMANFRGLASLLFANEHSGWLIPIIGTLSAAPLWPTLIAWKRAQVPASSDSTQAFDRAFSATLLFALLVSYHLNPHDLSLLLVPLAVLLRQAWPKTSPSAFVGKTTANWVRFSLIGVLFLPPLHIWALIKGSYALIALPMMVLFVGTCLAPQEKPAQTRTPVR